RPVGFGVAVGATDESDTLVGVRALGGIAVPHGALRGVASLLYTKFLNDPTDPENSTSLYALGVSADYVWMPVPRFAFAAGLGVGLDYASRTLDQGSDTSPWGTLRASPIIVRLLRGHVELGVHVQLVRTGDNTVFLGVAAIDLFPW
ncbi:MAG: hypothetical protein H7138_08685, partial [Myxococcales bacterium]|nr:hypothetical protein [Myxococcales bacterium]